MKKIKLSVTCYLYKILLDGKKVLQENVLAIFNNESFAEGNFRKCFLGHIVDKNKGLVKTNDFPSGKCVIKKYMKNNYLGDYVGDFKSALIAHQCALAFNKAINVPNMLNFIMPYVTVDILTMKATYVEPFLEGEFIKFSSNAGFESSNINASIPVAFSHYSWLYFKGKMAVLDVQGVIRNQKYYLTDPAVQSVDLRFGSTDLGASGLIHFLIFHKHNNICKNWKWVPKQFDALLNNCNAKSIKRTSFSFENRKNIEKYTPIYLALLKYVFP